MITNLMSRFVRPANSRDLHTVKHVSMLIRNTLALALGVGALAYYLHSRGYSGWALWLIVAITCGLTVYAGILTAMLHREISLRILYRTKRLALPAVLAEGIAAGERMNVPKVVEVITFRLREGRGLHLSYLRVFDCLMHDLLESQPALSSALRQISKNEAKA